MIREGKRMTPFFATGFTLVGIFVAVAIIVPSALQRSLNSGKLWIVAVALGCPILAIVSAFGAMTLLQMRINSFLLVMPTLVLGIGVDDGFLLIHSWLRHSHLNPRLRITTVLVDVGPSMTITTVTNVLSFGIGWFSPTPGKSLHKTSKLTPNFRNPAVLLRNNVSTRYCLYVSPVLVLARFNHHRTVGKQNGQIGQRRIRIV
jgi:hypothetical protein